MLQLGVLGDDRAPACLEVFAEGGERRVGVEQHEGVPCESGTSVEGVVAVAEPLANLQVRIAGALAVAVDRLPNGQDANIGARLGFEDVVGNPPGTSYAGASSGRHQQHEPTVTAVVVEGFRE